VVTFVIQLVEAARLIADSGATGGVQTIAVLVIVCFLVGIGCAWELIGGPSIGLRHEIAALARSEHVKSDATDAES
jgi:hypothetical protein